MMTYWVRMLLNDDSPACLDIWKTGETSNGETIAVFAIRAKTKEDIYQMLNQIIKYQILSIDEKPHILKYSDFAKPNSRYPIHEKYLDDPIDTTNDVLKRNNK